MNPLIHLEGKVAIVTGASRGIGEAIARAFAAHGARVMLAARKLEGVESVAKSLRGEGYEAFAMACHVGKEEDTKALVEKTTAQFGKVDVLVNNAATNPHFGPLVTATDGAWAKTFEVNLQGSFRLARDVASQLVEQGAKGSIINIASVAGIGSAPLQGVYGMTKAALISMTRTLAFELGPSGIRVNAIAPGLVETRLAGALVSNPEMVDRIVERTPLGRYAQPSEIAGGALYLASDASSFVTGHTLVIDGGMTISA